MAAQGDNPNIIIYFKEKYKMSIYSVDYKGNTPLHWACFNCAEHSVNFLLSFMNDINQQNDSGQTPLHIAIFTERIRIIKKLIRKGSDLNLKDNNGKTPIQLAIQLTGASSKVTNVLIENKPFKSWFHSKEKGVVNSIFNALTFLLIMFLFNLLIYNSQLSYLNSGYTGFFIMINVIFLLCFIVIYSSNPGIILKKENCDWFNLVCRKVNINNMCPYCKVTKEKFSKHCYSCKKCVKEQAHHCILFGNCIGQNNKILYIIYLSILIVYFVISYFISFHVFLLPEIRINKQKPYLAIFIFFKETFRDFIAILVMTNAIFALGISGFLIFNQVRKMVINEKMKEM